MQSTLERSHPVATPMPAASALPAAARRVLGLLQRLQTGTLTLTGP